MNYTSNMFISLFIEFSFSEGWVIIHILIITQHAITSHAICSIVMESPTIQNIIICVIRHLSKWNLVLRLCVATIESSIKNNNVFKKDAETFYVFMHGNTKYPYVFFCDLCTLKVKHIPVHTMGVLFSYFCFWIC